MKITVYGRVPGTHAVRIIAEFPNTPRTWSVGEILERFGIGSHLKAVATNDDGSEWIIQDFPPIQNS
jgi:hypothetical protein